MNIKKRKIIYNTLLAGFILIAAGSGLAIASRLAGREKNDAALAALTEGFADSGGERIAGRTETGTGTPQAESPGERLTPRKALELRAERLPEYRRLQTQNADMAGWVTIPGTKIDYPVMQTPDRPDYYLKHNFDREKSVYGVPYAAENCDLTQGSPGTVLYGHHMKNGSMFAALSGYTDEAFYQEHPWFWFDTLTEPGLYEIIGVCKASAAGGDELFGLSLTQDEQGYENYVREVKRRSFYDTGVSASWGEPLVTLMTCEYTTREGRLLVVGKRYTGDGEGETDESSRVEKVEE